MANLHTKYEVSMFNHYEDMNGNAKCRIFGGLGVRGDPRSPVMSPFDRVPTISYLTSLKTMYLSFLQCFDTVGWASGSASGP